MFYFMQYVNHLEDKYDIEGIILNELRKDPLKNMGKIWMIVGKNYEWDPDISVKDNINRIFNPNSANASACNHIHHKLCRWGPDGNQHSRKDNKKCTK